jgi:hypothetical protein
MENTNTPTSVKSDNELIAEFMGSKPYNDGRYGIMWPDPTDGNKVGFGLHYDTKWDWIMPVVEKIEKLGYGFTVDPWGIVVIDYTTGNEEERVAFLNDDNYEKIYQYYHTVVEFIKWYNTTTNENGK